MEIGRFCGPGNICFIRFPCHHLNLSAKSGGNYLIAR